MSIEQDPFGREYRAGRLSDEETARKMLDAAISKVHQEGLPISFDALRFEDIIAEAGVARSAVYRQWPTKHHFYARLLLELAGFSHTVVGAYDAETIAISVRGVLERPELLRTPSGRRALLVDLMREGAHQNFMTLATERSWAVYVTLLATIESLPDNEFRTKLQTTLRGTEDHFLGLMARFYDVMLKVLGYRIRPDLEGITTRTIAQLGAAVVEGLTLGNSADPEVGRHRLHLDPFYTGRQSAWSLPGLGFAGIVSNMIEPDPDHDGVWSDEEIARRIEHVSADAPEQ